MAKEEEVKKIDFKVTANCCDGCKRKIIKALSIKGVLKTEIHPSLPKITVTGNFDPRIIVKKLAKVGKSAEIILRDEKEEKKKSNDSKNTDEKEKKPKEEKSSDSKSKTDDSKESKETKNKEKGDEKSKKEEKENKDGNNDNASLFPTIITAIPNYTMNMNPSVVNSAIPPLYYHPEPVMVPMPMTHYSMNSNPYSMNNSPYSMNNNPYSMHNNPYSVPIPYGYRENSYYEAPINRMAPPPPVRSQPTVFNDYFNEDNTSGCQIM